MISVFLHQSYRIQECVMINGIIHTSIWSREILSVGQMLGALTSASGMSKSVAVDSIVGIGMTLGGRHDNFWEGDGIRQDMGSNKDSDMGIDSAIHIGMDSGMALGMIMGLNKG